MKNSNFKNSFISTLAVTVVGVLLFGVNAALSETPMISPPGAGVGPTFTGLNLTGGVQNSTSVADPVTVNDGLDVEGYLAVTGNIHNPGSDIVAIVDDVTISGDISNPGAPVTVDDHLVVNNSIDAKDVIKNSGTANSGKLVIDDGLKVTGDLTTTGNTTLGGYLTIGSGQYLTSDLVSSSNPGVKPIRFNSTIGGIDEIYLNIVDSVNIMDGNWLIADGSADIHGLILNTKEGKTETVIPGKGTVITATDLPVTIDDDLVLNKDLSVKGEVTGNLYVNGKITSKDGVGTFTRIISDSDGLSSNGNTPYTVTAGVGIDKTLYCPSGSKVVSCQVKPTEVTGYDIQNFSLSAYMDDALTYCKATVHNGSTNEKKFLIYQICFNSTL
ncbi:MAG: hypothetical protein AAB848_00165 [Patescibacteria group bacterium]